MTGRSILTAAAMRDAELAAVQTGVPLSELMERAGEALARLAWRMASGRPIHILAGPGNNGGDGYVAARKLREMGAEVALTALAPPRTGLAQAAAARWVGKSSTPDAVPVTGAILVDCLFGTGLNRPLEAPVIELLQRHGAAAARILAADLPSGVDSDSGGDLGCPIRADATLAFGALKPAHVLYPAAARVGHVHVADIGIVADSSIRMAAMPDLAVPSHESQKYVRGLVAVVAGRMSGAAELSARAALRSGAGYVRLIGSALPPTAPHAIVRQGWRSGEALTDARIGAIVIGPGLGQGEEAVARLEASLATGRPLVIDADALALIAERKFAQPAILTPHAGEFARMGGDTGSDKIQATLQLASRLQAVVINKGPDTVIAAADGRVAIASPGNNWLSTAGTGDVLAGIAGAMLARGVAPFEAAQAAVLLHQRAATRALPGFAADDLMMEPIWP